MCEGGSGDRTGFVVCVMHGVVRMALSAVDLCGLLSTWRLKFDSFCLHLKKKIIFLNQLFLFVSHIGVQMSPALRPREVEQLVTCVTNTG